MSPGAMGNICRRFRTVLSLGYGYVAPNVQESADSLDFSVGAGGWHGIRL
jgi:hypothetical protein